MEPDERIQQLEQRVEQLEEQQQTTNSNLTRRALTIGGLGLGGSLLGLSGTGAAASGDVGTPNSRVDVFGDTVDANQINGPIDGSQLNGPLGTASDRFNVNADTLDANTADVDTISANTYQGLSTGGIALESGDSITTHSIDDNTRSGFQTLYSGNETTVVGGTFYAFQNLGWEYQFANGSTINGSVEGARGTDKAFNSYQVNFLPPAKSVTDVLVNAGSGSLGAILYTLD